MVRQPFGVVALRALGRLPGFGSQLCHSLRCLWAAGQVPDLEIGLTWVPALRRGGWGLLQGNLLRPLPQSPLCVGTGCSSLSGDCDVSVKFSPPLTVGPVRAGKGGGGSFRWTVK